MIAGAVNTGVGLLMYPFLYFALSKHGLGYLQILIVSQIVCISVAFLTNKYFVFKTRGNFLVEIIKFVWFHGMYLVANLIALPIMVEKFGANPVIAQTVFAAAVIVSSYFWHNKVTFSEKKI